VHLSGGERHYIALIAVQALGLPHAPATDPVPATPDVLWRDRDGAIWREGEGDTLQLFLFKGERPDFRCPFAPRDAVAELYGPLTKYEPVAPQAPAEPIATGVGASAGTSNAEPSTVGPAGSAVPEDTATPDEHEVLIYEDTDSVRGPGWYIADCLACTWRTTGLEPVVEVAAEEHKEAASHRADTTRPEQAGQES
jgi:hypothetical protein